MTAKAIALAKLVLFVVVQFITRFNQLAQERRSNRQAALRTKAEAFDKLARSIKARRNGANTAISRQLHDDGFKRKD